MEHRITKRLNSTLKTIRAHHFGDHDFAGWSRTWVDAICINQADTIAAKLERGQQVSMMHKIFGNAVEVVVHLAEEVEDFDFLVDLIKDPSPLHAIASDPEELIHTSVEISWPNEDSSILIDQLRAFEDVMQGEWFARDWCFQEYILARRVSYLVGHEVFREDFLAQMISTFNHPSCAGVIPRLLPLGDALRSWIRVMFLCHVRENKMLGKEFRYKLSKMCAVAALYESTDERDFIYSMSAMVEPADNLQVDYTEDAINLAQRVSHNLLEQGRGKVVLHSARGIGRYDDEGLVLSSWGFQLRVIVKFDSSEAWAIKAGLTLPFSAGGLSEHTETQICPNYDHFRCMKVVALVEDEVRCVSERIPTLKWDDPAWRGPRYPPAKLKYNSADCIVLQSLVLHAWIKHVVSILRTLPGKTDMEPDSPLIWRTILHDMLSFPARLPASFQGIATEYMRSLHFGTASFHAWANIAPNDVPYEEACRRIATIWSDWMDWLQRSDQVTALTVNDLSNRELESGDLNAKAAAALLTAGGRLEFVRMIERRICTTRKGRVASIPQAARAGDKILVVRGVSMPFVFRTHGEKYRLVGNAYVNGIMDGEAISENTIWEDVHVV